MEIHNNAKPELNSELDNNVDLFDVLLTLAENFRLLILGSLLAGACAYGLAFLLPPKYESTSVLRAEPSVAAYMTTPSVLDATLQKLGYLDGLDGEKAEDARESLARHVEARAGRNDKLVTLTVTGRSPEAAQSLNREILQNVYLGSRPRDVELNRLQKEKAALVQQAEELTATNQKAQKLLDEASPLANLGALAESISTISTTMIRVRESITAVDKKLQGLTDEDLVQPPTHPQKAASPQKGKLAILATLAAAVLLLIFVFGRNAWKASSNVEQYQQRLHLLKRKYGFGR